MRDGDFFGDRPVYRRGTGSSHEFQNGFHRFFWLLRFDLSCISKKLVFDEPVGKCDFGIFPPEAIRDVRRLAPDPVFQLGIDDNRCRTCAPTAQSQVVLYGCLQIDSALVLSATALMVEDDNRMSVGVSETGQNANTLIQAAGIARGVRDNFVRDRTDAE